MNILRKKENTTKKLAELIKELHNQKYKLNRDKILLDLFLSDGIVYLIDIDTQDMLFMNEKGIAEYGEYEGKQCLDVLNHDLLRCENCIINSKNSKHNFDKEIKFERKIVKDKGEIYLSRESNFKIVNGQERHLRLVQTINITEQLKDE